MNVEIKENLVRMTRSSVLLTVSCAALFAASLQTAAAATLCVDPSGGGGCYSKIQTAVNHASANDVINVKKGTYYEDVTIGIPLSLIGAGAHQSVIDADSFANAIFVDGFDHPGLHEVTIAGFTVENARYEAILVVSATDITVRNTTMINNDKFGPVFSSAPNCNGQPSFETDESGDCGGALHLIGTSNSVVSGNVMTGNADGILISDETAESSGNLITHNIVKNNPLDCGIVLASHPPVGSSAPYYAAHYGVDNNTIADNLSKDNGVQVGGAGVGLFSDGNGPGRVSGNVVIDNTLTGNGIGGVSLHSHVGPAFHAPADNFNGNHIIGNTISGNLADEGDTATPGRVGININSGGGGSPVTGTVITGNNISDEDVDIAINTPALVDIHLNNLLGGKIGVADICAFDGASASACTGTNDAIQNYWGCDDGPGAKKCTTVSGANILYIPWLQQPVTDDPDNDQ
jgi:parallel beta-helix repeat protein